MEVRTRFAPSPTGFMHIGNLRTAIFEYLVAKHNNGTYILRIEDTDQNRKVDGAVDFIYDTLKLCDMHIDEGPNNEGNYGPYTQSERKDIYKKYALELIAKGQAYYCFCTEEELEKMRESYTNRNKAFLYDGRCSKISPAEIEEKLNNNIPYVIRQKMPKYGQTEIDDVVYGKIKIDNSILDDQILLKSDGFPTYNFANVIDDHEMKITHVIRGKEYLDQTAKYNLLYEAFGWEKPVYIHVAMVLGEDGTKLSKRNGDASFMDLYDEGYLPAAVVNYLALLGWSPKDNQEIFSMPELILSFDETRINKSSSQYDVKKLNWFNEHYIKQMSDDAYLNFIKPFMLKAYDFSNKSEEFINRLALIYKEQLSYGNQIKDLIAMFFNDELNISEEAKEFMISDDSIEKTINIFKEEISSLENWSVENIALAINNTKEKCSVKGKLLYMPIRIKVSGLMHGPELADTIYLLGKDTILKRLS